MTVGGRLCAPPLTLYVHLPWCVRKCPYCDFNSHAVRGAPDYAGYVDALVDDLRASAPPVADRPVGAVFFGGGTPSLFPPEEIGRFLAEAGRCLELEAGAEVTLEANPGTVERGDFAAYREAGVNRVSLGVQSFDPDKLRALGRIHSADEAHRALDELQRSGIVEFNVDLMHGLPGQSPDGAVADVAAALSHGPTHVSHYQLTIEPNTLFHHRPPTLPDHDLSWEIQEACHEALGTAGFEQYEVSAWARTGSRCRHNLNYWSFGDYLGIGAGAHGKLTDPAGNTVRRTWKPRHPDQYVAGPTGHRGGDRLLEGGERLFEFLLNALRLSAGFRRGWFEERTGLSSDRLDQAVAPAVARGLLEATPAGFRPTPHGFLFLNDLQALFLNEVETP